MENPDRKAEGPEKQALLYERLRHVAEPRPHLRQTRATNLSSGRGLP